MSFEKLIWRHFPSLVLSMNEMFSNTTTWTHIRLYCVDCPVWWGCRIQTASLQRGKPPTNECPGYDTKQSNCEFPVIVELWGMQSTLSLPLLPGPLWPGVVAPDRVLSMGQIELNCVHMLNWIVWNRTVFTFNCL